jgi:sulfopyruvate decarboxylase TPP-binding subunit
VTDFLRRVDATHELCDELIAADFTLFVGSRSDRHSPLHEALDQRVGVFVAPTTDNAVVIAAGLSRAGGYPAVLLSEAEIGDAATALDDLVAYRQAPILLVIVADGECDPGVRRPADLLMADLCVETVRLDAAARASTKVRVARQIIRERQRPAALLVSPGTLDRAA